MTEATSRIRDLVREQQRLDRNERELERMLRFSELRTWGRSHLGSIRYALHTYRRHRALVAEERRFNAPVVRRIRTWNCCSSSAS